MKEGELKTVKLKCVRRECEHCDKKAVFKHTFLLEGMRNNPASSAYGMDDCSYCEDATIFTCHSCSPEMPHGYVVASRYEFCERFEHLFLAWKEHKGDQCADDA